MNLRIRNNLKFFFLIFSGLIFSQIISFFKILNSNKELLIKSKALLNENYFFFTPAHLVSETLTKSSNAFFGAVSITFTSGIFLTFSGVLAALIYLKSTRKKFLICALFFFYFLLIFYIKNFAAFAAVPLFVFLISIKLKPRLKSDIIFICTVILIFASGFLYKGQSIFSDIRDKVLLNYKTGIILNTFYYNYTLYPAELIKPLNSKKLKLFKLSGFNNKEKARIENILYDLDFFHVKTNKAQIDLYIKKKNNSIKFTSSGKTFYIESNFSKHRIQNIIDKISNETDNSFFFRKITITGLLMLPFMLLYFAFFSFKIIFSIFVSGKKASFYSSIIILTIFFYFFLPVLQTPEINRLNLKAQLNSPKKLTRLQALKYSFSNKIPVENISKHLESEFIPEVSWALLNLKVQTSNDLDIIFKKTKSNYVNIRYKAYQKLGGVSGIFKKKTFNFLKQNFPTIKNWYVQWYAYTYTKNIIH